jgi:ferric-chelate reductase
MGWWGWTEAHPFTISTLGKGGEGMVLFCKRNGDWTGKLYEMAKAAGYGDGDVLDAEVGREVRIIVEGPYGAFSFLIRLPDECDAI